MNGLTTAGAHVVAQSLRANDVLRHHEPGLLVAASNLGLEAIGSRGDAVKFEQHKYTDLMGGLQTGEPCRILYCGWMYNGWTALYPMVVPHEVYHG